jgi:hypothetical protein
MPLKLSSSLTLPNDAVTQTLAFIARKGAGKTYAAGKLTEELLGIGATVIVIDVVGTWYGLRLNASGKGQGLPIAIFGGEHGDVDLNEHQGEALGQLLVNQNLSAVVDISKFRKGERRRFATDFAESLFHHAKSNRSPRMLIMEEAQTLAPQRLQPGEERMLGAFEDIVRLGRNYGIGATLLSQRPQSINKEVLNQVECLFVGQLNGDLDRKAIEAWVSDHKANKDWTHRLPQLERGKMIVWSPQWLKVMKEVEIGRKKTFDASATPELGAPTARPKSLAAVDAVALRSALQAAAPRAHLAKSNTRASAESHELHAVRAELERVRHQTTAAHATLQQTADKLEQALSTATAALRGMQRLLKAGEGAKPTDTAGHPTAQNARAKPSQPASPPATRRRNDASQTTGAARQAGNLAGPEQRILDALAWLESIGVETPEHSAVAFLAGYTVGGGAFNNPRGRLRKRGFVAYVPGDRIQLTDAGRSAANVPDAPLTSATLHERVLERLPGPEQRLLAPLLDAYPKAMHNDELAAAAGYTAGAGAYNNPRGRLRSLGLVEYPAPGQVRARDLLFLRNA